VTVGERRKAIIDVLCKRRFDTVGNLACEFNVSIRTIKHDVEMLAIEYPIYTTQGKGGGIHVMEGYVVGKSYLSREQQELLERILPKLKGRGADVMKSILDEFGKKGGKNYAKKQQK